MERDEIVELLKGGAKGVTEWNRRRAELGGRRTLLNGANLDNANMSGVKLTGAYLAATSMRTANLKRAHLTFANLSGADLGGADLSFAYLQGADFTSANLEEAKLHHADLGMARLQGTVLAGTDFAQATLNATVVATPWIHQAKGLEKIHFVTPSILSRDALASFGGQAPPVFLKGCGFTDWEIEATRLYQDNLTARDIAAISESVCTYRSERPIQARPVFISHSHKDAELALAFRTELESRSISCWSFKDDMRAGKMDEQISLVFTTSFPIVVLVLSEASVESDWVEWEASEARKLEKKIGADVLCPIALDDSWKSCNWPGPLRNQIEKYNVLDFSKWQETGSFAVAFGKLFDGIQANYAHPLADHH